MSDESLKNYIKLSEIVDELDKRICEIEDTIDALDKNIDDAETMGFSQGFINSMCENRNILDLARIDLSILKNKNEKSLLDYQRIRLLSK